MKICTRCGVTHDDSAKFCTNCGAAFETERANEKASGSTYTVNAGVGEGYTYPTPHETPASHQINVAQLVWSIINVIACCTPLGIVSLIFVIVAQSAATAESEAKNLKIAKILNIIGTSVMAVFVVLYIILVVIVLVAGGMSVMDYDTGYTLWLR